jgi:hypothetical protein
MMAFMHISRIVAALRTERELSFDVAVQSVCGVNSKVIRIEKGSI